MITILPRRLSAVLLLLCAVTTGQAAATPAAAPADAASSAAAPDDDSDGQTEESSGWDSDARRPFHGKWRRRESGRDDRDVVSIGHNSKLAQGQQADSVVSILGSSTNEGQAVDVVSVLGNTRSTGAVSDNAVSVLGSTYIDGKVDGDVVAVFGNLELGPHAEVGGDVVAVLGRVQRDPAAIIHGSLQNIFDADFGNVDWLSTWIKNCLLLGRPLALVRGLGWAWALALGFLAFYACLAFLCRDSVNQCMRTFETQPGRTLLAALIAMLLTPVLMVLLGVSVIGIAAIPFIVVALFCAGLFGKAVMLAWLGGRILGRRAPGPLLHPAVAVLAGGALVLLLYLVPVLGFLVYKLLGLLGLGAVVYTLILAAQARNALRDGEAHRGSTATGGSTAMGGSPGARPPAGSAAQDATAAAATAAAAQDAAAAATAAASPSAGATGAAAPPHVTAAMPRAGFWIRMAALLLDLLLVGFAMSVLRHGGHLQLVVLGAYGAVMWKLRGSTVGGIVFDLRVVRLDGRAVDWETAIIRALGCFLSLAVAGLGFLWIVFDPANQAWHDKIAGTAVVRLPKSIPLAALP